jgi:hypothetical protein
MAPKPFLIVLYGCTLAGQHAPDPKLILPTADRLNQELDNSHKPRLMGNFDAMRGYIGLALATSDETLAHGLDIPLMPALFTIGIDAIESWVASFVTPNRMQVAETQWMQLQRASRSTLVVEVPSAIPNGQLFLVQDQNQARSH